MSSDPDQVPIEFDEAVFGRPAPPAFVVVDLALVRGYEISDFLGSDRVGYIEYPNTGVEPGGCKDFGLGYAGSEPTLRVVRAEAAARETEIVVRSIRRGLRFREQSDDFRIARVLHIDHVRRVVDLAAVGFEGLVQSDHHVLEPRVRRVGEYGIDGVKRDGAECVEFILDMPHGLGMRDVAEVHHIHSESAEAAVADVSAVFDALGDGEGAVVAGPRSAVAGENVFLVFRFLAETLAGNPPTRDFLNM